MIRYANFSLHRQVICLGQGFIFLQRSIRISVQLTTIVVDTISGISKNQQLLYQYVFMAVEYRIYFFLIDFLKPSNWRPGGSGHVFLGNAKLSSVCLKPNRCDKYHALTFSQIKRKSLQQKIKDQKVYKSTFRKRHRRHG